MAPRFLRFLATGAVAAAASAGAAALFSRGRAARPLNAVAHIYDGGRPSAHDGRGRRNTLVGLALHTGAAVWWAAFYELALERTRAPMATAAALSAIAYVVDYGVVGKRFQPGFETQLTRGGLFAVYAALAAGFALSGQRRAPVRERQHQRERAALARRALEPQLTAQQARQLPADR